MELKYCCADDGRAYYTKAHVPFEDFMTALCREVDPDDPILSEQPTHCWMARVRAGRDDITSAAPWST